MARLLDEHPGQIAGMIIEPIMMNAGHPGPSPVTWPRCRDVLHSRGALLAFDEVKTGLTTWSAGSAEDSASPRTSSAWPSPSEQYAERRRSTYC